MMPIRGGMTRLFWSVAGCACLLSALIPSAVRADKITLRDGREIEGKFSRLSSMLVGPLLGQSDMPATKLLVMADDDLKRTFVSEKWVEKVDPAPAGQRLEEINIPQRIAQAGSRLASVGQAIEVTPFDAFGVRTYSMMGQNGRIDVVQGITKITPVWSQVQGLQTQPPLTPFLWDMRVATSSIPREVLSQILSRQIDSKNPEDRLKIVRLYLQAQRYRDAEAELNQILSTFPERDSLRDVARELKQLAAKQILGEIDVRRSAGQHRLAYSMLERFPAEGVAGNVLQQVQAKVEEYTTRQQQRQTIVAQLTEQLAALSDAALRERTEPLIKEIEAELSITTMDRMATYRRFADDATVTPERKLALAISGWLAGADDATENIQMALSMSRLRGLVLAYLREDARLERDELFSQIEAEEAASPKWIAAIVAHLKPPRDTPPQEVSGFYEFTIPGPPDESEITYYVQLPPEYDPYGSYPCIVTLHGAYSTPVNQIDWWAGDLPKVGEKPHRGGQAMRHGYIVISPEWTTPHQRQYDGSPREHHAVLASLRDACRRFAIDTDRVFLSGHSVGGNAVWDIGLAHPDLWAGVIPIAASVEKTVKLYWKNAAMVPLYFVCGELDGDKMVKNSSEFDRYMNRSTAFDCTVIEYLGRGHEHYYDEVLRIFDWMGRKRRDFAPRQFSVVTQRSWDDYFWWVELRNFQPGARSTPVESSLLANGVTVKTGGKATVWLSPEIVNFAQPITVTVNGQRQAPAHTIRPDLSVLLEDVRTRGDRRHPFWAKVE